MFLNIINTVPRWKNDFILLCIFFCPLSMWKSRKNKPLIKIHLKTRYNFLRLSVSSGPSSWLVERFLGQTQCWLSISFCLKNQTRERISCKTEWREVAKLLAGYFKKCLRSLKTYDQIFASGDCNVGKPYKLYVPEVLKCITLLTSNWLAFGMSSMRFF